MDKRSSFRLEDQLLQESPINKNSLKKTRPVPKRKRFQNLIKSFIGRGKQQTIDSPTVDITDATATTTIALEPQAKIENDGINKTIERQNIYENNGSNIQLCDNQKLTESTLSLVTVQQKLWNVVPLLKRENNRQNSINGKSNSVVKYTSMRKCETVLALTRQFSTYSYIPEDVEIENYKSPGTFYKRSISLNVPELKHFHNIEPIQPLNRLRSCKSITSNTNCSRCSSILSESQSQSSVKNETQENDSSERRFSNFESINKINYIPRTDSEEIHQLRRTSIKSNRNSSEKDYVDGKTEINPDQLFICKLCLTETDSKTDATKINYCGCNFCTECMKYYVEFEIKEGAYEISCPDAQCPLEGVLNLTEISALVPADIMEKHHRYRFNREVELDKFRTWCPRAGCETVCLISPQSTSTTTNCKTMIPGSSSSTKCNKSNESIIPYAVQCPTCQEEFCPECRKPWHQNLSCEEYRKRLVEEGLLEEISDFPYESDSIKFCPMCGVPIEKDSGCAQMMCKRCKHVFCWYCLASLDDDFLLRHYDTGPCKNKLGHSRASVIWHRAQVIGIFAGFGMLLVIASPLLLLAVPCILCCKCQPCCNGESKTEDADNDFDEVPLGR